MQAEADLKATDKEGNTALILAAAGGHVENLEKLLAAGADVNLTQIYGRTALMSAASHGQDKCIETDTCRIWCERD